MIWSSFLYTAGQRISPAQMSLFLRCAIPITYRQSHVALQNSKHGLQHKGNNTATSTARNTTLLLGQMLLESLVSLHHMGGAVSLSAEDTFGVRHVEHKLSCTEGQGQKKEKCLESAHLPFGQSDVVVAEEGRPVSEGKFPPNLLILCSPGNLCFGSKLRLSVPFALRPLRPRVLVCLQP